MHVFFFQARIFQGSENFFIERNENFPQLNLSIEMDGAFR